MRRTSIIWSIPREQLAQRVAKHNTYKAVLETFGLENKGQNFRTLRRRLVEENIPFDHFLKKGENLVPLNKAIPLEAVCTKHSSYNRGHLKRRLLSAGALKNECAICASPPMWNGSLLTLQLDHVNGVSNDNRLENLRLLCPNCHSQTHSFAGRKTSSQ